jgi:hypothetical protein
MWPKVDGSRRQGLFVLFSHSGGKRWIQLTAFDVLPYSY